MRKQAITLAVLVASSILGCSSPQPPSQEQVMQEYRKYLQGRVLILEDQVERKESLDELYKN